MIKPFRTTLENNMNEWMTYHVAWDTYREQFFCCCSTALDRRIRIRISKLHVIQTLVQYYSMPTSILLQGTKLVVFLIRPPITVNYWWRNTVNYIRMTSCSNLNYLTKEKFLPWCHAFYAFLGYKWRCRKFCFVLFCFNRNCSQN